MKSDLIILGSDTDAGKTTFALLWLSAFADQYAYWKPIESGPSDSDTVRRLVPEALVYSPAQRFTEPVAPPLAARQQSESVWTAEHLAVARPVPSARSLLMETFGSPFSPLNEHELQIELICRLNTTMVLVSSSSLGAIGRTLQTLEGLRGRGVIPRAAVLVGPVDEFATEALRKHRPDVPVFSLQSPAAWSVDGVRKAAADQRATLEAMRAVLAAPSRLQNADDNKSTEVARLLDRDSRFIWHPYTSLRDPTPPLPIVGAQDEFLYLADGRRMIDGISSWWTILHGHRHPVLMQALADASRQIDHVLFAGATHPWAVELAELMLQSMPWTGGRAFYSDNGSTAVEVALKMAYQYWRQQGELERTRFVGFQHGYHGDTFGAMAVSRDPVFFGQFEPLLFQADIVPLDPNTLDEQLRRTAKQTAAVIVEPLVQGAGGMRMHSPETLRQLFEVARRHGVLFIADEVMTGGGRTGTLWAHQAAGIAPDLVCAAKTLAGGALSLAASLAAPHLVAAFDTEDRSRTFFHGHSFTAHPLACAVAIANWKLLTATPLQRPREFETFWNEALADLRSHPKVKDVRVRGSIAAIELGVPGGYLAQAGQRMRQSCLEHGVLLRPLGNVLYALPPYCISRESLEQIVAAMTAAIETTG
jgi:adenosylmethionine---8-amino-7-oxononanoate aminotransferase